ncbi:MAG: hypothetical protein CEN89_327 [Candidatus Berkelbacteria bacterium Licking1014_7]|uniref:Uncharacterized protein n=1 Tax=Candidatus Berkelbacteria bacterium Licking1014_7 TaxID=2017147 RepID=A0A554LJC3_9BACT|nr:MAG: hypothetical protein CEN89_327 [Candidatus Berkelbacteria bacterium Licking1014_7]
MEHLAKVLDKWMPTILTSAVFCVLVSATLVANSYKSDVLVVFFCCFDVVCGFSILFYIDSHNSQPDNDNE